MARNSRNRYTIPIQHSTRQNLCNRAYDVNVSSCVNIPDSSNIEYIDDIACDDPARQLTGNLHISNCSNGSGSTVNLNTNTFNNTNIKLDIQTDVVVTETGIQQHINTVMDLIIQITKIHKIVNLAIKESMDLSFRNIKDLII